MMKKTIMLILTLSMVLALCAGCGGNKEEAQPTAAQKTVYKARRRR